MSAERGVELGAVEPPRSDWSLRPFAAERSPLWVGAGLAALFFFVSVAFRLAHGEFGQVFWRNPYVWLDVLNAVLFAYVPTATYMLRNARLRDLRALRNVRKTSERDLARLEVESLRPEGRRLVIAGLCGAVLFGALPAVDPGFWEVGEVPPLLTPVMLFFVLRTAAVGWFCGLTFVYEATAVTAFYRAGVSGLTVDLLDLDALGPFARAGQRGAFVWVLGSSLVTLFWLGPASGNANAIIVGAVLIGVSLGFFFSIYGAHKSIRAAKRSTLQRLTDQIRDRTQPLLAGEQVPPPPLSELIALRELIGQMREWPLGASGVLRSLLIPALAVGSWLGGALMERLLESAIG